MRACTAVGPKQRKRCVCSCLVTNATETNRLQIGPARCLKNCRQPHTAHCLAMEFPIGIAAHSVRLAQAECIVECTLTQSQVPDMAGLVHGETFRSYAALHSVDASLLGITLQHLQVCELFRCSFVPRSSPELCLHGCSGSARL